MNSKNEKSDTKISKSDEDLPSEKRERLDEPDDDKAETELVFDDEAEEYEENFTGVKFKYDLKNSEICEVLENSDVRAKNNQKKINYTIVQILLLCLILLAAVMTSNFNYLIFSVLPVLATLGIWLFPPLMLLFDSKKVFPCRDFYVEIYPDEIEVQNNNEKRIIKLDGTCVYQETENLMVLKENDDYSLIIPFRAIEKDHLSDVQAMIFAGSKPKF